MGRSSLTSSTSSEDFSSLEWKRSNSHLISFDCVSDASLVPEDTRLTRSFPGESSRIAVCGQPPRLRARSGNVATEDILSQLSSSHSLYLYRPVNSRTKANPSSVFMVMPHSFASASNTPAHSAGGGSSVRGILCVARRLKVLRIAAAVFFWPTFPRRISGTPISPTPPWSMPI